jgi:hypothetical protein
LLRLLYYIHTDVNIFYNSDSWLVALFALPHAYTDRAVVAYKHARRDGGVQLLELIVNDACQP